MRFSENQILSKGDSLRVMGDTGVWIGRCLPLVRRRHDLRTGDWLDRGFLWDADITSSNNGVSVYAAEAWPTVDEQELGSRYITSRFPRYNYADFEHALAEGWRVILDDDAAKKADL